MSLLIVGTVAFDMIETPFGKTEKILGGAGTYAALAASLLTTDIRLVSVVGGDFPDAHIALFRHKGIDVDGLKVVPGEKSFFWSGRYHSNMNKRDTLVTDLNVLAGFDPVLPPAYHNSRYLLLGNLTPSIQRRVIEQLQVRPNLVCMDTMNFWMDTAMDDLLRVLKMVDVLTINDEEARQLSGEYSLAKAARKILTMGPSILIIKKGEHGALMFSGHNMFFAPAVLVEHVVDPTGAGDSFAGAFMGYIANAGNSSFNTLKNALMYGAVIASFSVSEFGTDGLVSLTPDKIEQRMDTFRSMINYL